MLKKTLETTIKKVVTNLIEQEIYTWPPECATFYYQPPRPELTPNITNTHQVYEENQAQNSSSPDSI